MAPFTRREQRASQSYPVHWANAKDVGTPWNCSIGPITIRPRGFRILWARTCGLRVRKVSVFRRPESFFTDMVTPFAVVDQGSPPNNDSNRDQGYPPDSRCAGGDQPPRDWSVSRAVAHGSYSSSTADSFGSSEPPTARETCHNLSDRSTQAIDPSITQCEPNSTGVLKGDVLRHLERHVGGRATCLWLREDNHQCGYSSQIDSVKRHIKRVHYRLR